MNVALLLAEESLFTPGSLISGLLIGAVGFVLFLYGRKQEDFPAVASGLALSIVPVLVHSVLLMWVLAAGCLGAKWALNRVL
jgi:hypothetical protein